MTTFSRRNLLIGTGGAVALVAAGGTTVGATTPRHDAGVVLRWNRTLLGIVRTPGTQPATVHATRGFAMMHAAVSDAVVATTGRGRSLLARVDGGRGASPVAAAAQAAHDVLSTLYPALAAALDRQLDGDLATVDDRRSRAAGVRVGRVTARRLLAARANDGSAATPPVLHPGTRPGEYRPTPPNFTPAVFTHWPAVRPFVIERAGRFRPPPYPHLAGQRYAQAANEVQRLGQDTSTARTADQTTQARFWAAPIWNYWNEITQSVIIARAGGLATAATVFARLNLAFADAVIAFYDGKYHFRIWRPVTAVRLADTDGNPATRADPSWNSLATTPADPAYPGAHSVVSAAAATVLRDAFGATQRVSVTSEALPGVVREFGRFDDVATEAGLSRIFAGVHSRPDHDAGIHLGIQVARAVLHSL